MPQDIGSATEKMLDVHDMHSLFNEMGRLCNECGITLEVAIYGGSALMLDFSYRQTSHDIDFVPVSCGAEMVKEIARRAAINLHNCNLSEDIMRDDVSIFVSDCPEYCLHGDYGGENGRFRVFKATPAYILAMKVLSMRSSLETQDLYDIWHLIDACKMASVKEAVDLVQRFYPDKDVPRRNRLILEDVFDEKNAGRPYTAMIGW